MASDQVIVGTLETNTDFPQFTPKPSKNHLPSFLKSSVFHTTLCDFLDKELFYSQNEVNDIGVPFLDPTGTYNETTYQDKYFNLKWQLERIQYLFRPEAIIPDFPGDEKDTLLDDVVSSLGALFGYTQDQIIRQYLFVQGILNLAGNINYQTNYLQDTLWRKFDILSIPFKRQWRTSLKAYRFIFGNIFRHGGVYLESIYNAQSTNQIQFANKKFRLVDYTSANNFLPISITNDSGTRFPLPGKIEGLKDYNDYSGLKQLYDTGLVYDSKITYDTTIFPIMGKSMSLEITIDRLLYHTNSIGTNECLMDTMFLDYCEREANNTKKVTENISIGTQLCLCTTDIGTYAFGSLPYTLPSLKTNFQVILANWNADNVITQIKLGTGTNSNLFVNLLDLSDIPTYTDTLSDKAPGSSYYFSKYTDPTNITQSSSINPVNVSPTMGNAILATNVGQFEIQDNVSGFTAYSVWVGKTTVSNFPIAFTYNNPPNTNEIDLKNLFITEGTISFYILGKETTNVESIVSGNTNNIPSSLTNFQTKITATQVFNTTTLSWEFLISYSIYVTYIVDSINNITTTGWYDITSYVNNQPNPEAYFGMSLSNSEIIVDYKNGTITINLNSASSTALSTVVTYTYNSTRDLASTNDKSGIVAITEMGCFNKDNLLIAYANFPPVIYDTDKNHFAFDLFFRHGLYPTQTVSGLSSIPSSTN